MHSPSGNGFVGRLDPRARIVLALAFAVVVVASDGFPVLGLALGTALAVAAAARVATAGTAKRVLAMDAFIVLMLVMLPFTMPGEEVFRLGGLAASREGLLEAAAIALKANAVIVVVLALLGTMDAAALGHGLGHLRVPSKLVHLLLFTVRYIGVLEREYRRLRLAMRARAFRPGSNLHTWRSFGYLLGMLLVRSLDRSERIVAAMKCRGFRGRFYLLDHFALSRRDVWFIAAAILVLVLLAVLEWS